MKNKNQIAIISTAALFISTIPASAIAASASLTLSNINITATPLDDTSSIKWDYTYVPLIFNGDFFGHYGDNALLYSESHYITIVPDYIFTSDEDGRSIGGVGYSPSASSLSSSTSVPYTASSGSVLTNPDTYFTQPQFISMSANSSEEEVYADSYTTFYSAEYFHGKGAIEFIVNADYALFSDPGDGSVNGGANASVKISTDINGINTVLFNKSLGFNSNINPGPHSDSGEISLKFIAYGSGPNSVLDGRINWHVDTNAGTVFVPTAIPEPTTYALLLAGLGLLFFRTKTELNS